MLRRVKKVASGEWAQDLLAAWVTDGGRGFEHQKGPACCGRTDASRCTAGNQKSTRLAAGSTDSGWLAADRPPVWSVRWLGCCDLIACSRDGSKGQWLALEQLGNEKSSGRCAQVLD